MADSKKSVPASVQLAAAAFSDKKKKKENTVTIKLIEQQKDLNRVLHVKNFLLEHRPFEYNAENTGTVMTDDDINKQVVEWVSKPKRRSTRNVGDETNGEDLEFDSDDDEPGARAKLQRESTNIRNMGFLYKGKSLFCMTVNTPFRKKCIDLVDDIRFENFILFVIFCNCIFLAWDNPLDTNQTTADVLLTAEYVFTALFTAEMFCKIFAMGFFFNGSTSYLRDPWNVMDFAVVVSAYIPIFFDLDQNVSSVRMLRLLRPMRTVTTLPGLRILVNSMFNAMPLLSDVFVLLSFIFFLFGISGMQLFGGKLRQQCSLDEEVFIADPDQEFRCRLGRQYGVFACAPGTFCMDSGENPNRDTAGFDNIFMAWVTIIQSTSLEGWVDVTYYTWEAVSYWSTVYFVILIMIIAFFLLQLVTGVVYTAYATAEEEEKARTEMYLNEISGSTLHVNPEAVAVKQSQSKQKIRRESNMADSSMDLLNAIKDFSDEDSEDSSPDRHITFSAMDTVMEADEVAEVAFHNKTVDGKTVEAEAKNNKAESKSASAEKKSNDDGADWATSNTNEESETPEETTGIKPEVARRASMPGDVFDLFDDLSQPIEDGHIEIMGVNDRASLAKKQRESIRLQRKELAKKKAEEEEKKKKELLAAKKDKKTNASEGTVIEIVSDSWYSSATCKKLVESDAFEKGVIVVIILNTLVLAMEHHNQSDGFTEFLVIMNYIFTVVFQLEQLLKWHGQGVKLYFQDDFNKFDTIVIVASWVDIIVSAVGGSSGGFSAFRTFRLLRVFKLAKKWESLQKLIKTILATISQVGYFTLLLLIFIYIFALLGMQLFAGQLWDEYEPGTPVEDRESIRSNYDDFWWAIITVFQIIGGENWNDVMVAGIASTTWWSAIYFVVLFVIGNYLVLNLFLAILLSNFDEDEEELDDYQKHELQLKQKGGEQPKKKRKKKKFFRAGGKNRKVPLAADGKQQQVGGRLGRGRHKSTVTPPEHNRTRSSSERKEAVSSLAADHKMILVAHDDEKAISHAVATVKVEPKAAEAPASLERVGTSTEGPPTVKRSHKRSATASTGNLGREHSGLTIRDIELSEINETNDTEDSKAHAHDEHSQDESDHEQVDVNVKIFSDSIGQVGYWVSPVEGTSTVFALKPDNCFRAAFAKMANSFFLECFIMFTIFFSIVVLCADAPDLDEKRDKVLITIIKFADLFNTIVFSTEAIVKIIAYGFCVGKTAYLREWWNALDFAIVIVSIVDILNQFAGLSITGLAFFKAFRALRSLRPLRVVSRNESLMVVIQSIFRAIPGVINVFMLGFLNLVVFGILGVNLFSGLFYRCEVSTIVYTEDGSYIVNDASFEYDYNMEQCLEQAELAAGTDIQYLWKNPDVGNFDNIFYSVLTLFEMSTMEMWPELLYRAVDITDFDEAPVRDNSMGFSLYFVVFLIIGNFFVSNLFVGMIVDTFSKMKTIVEGSAVLTKKQQMWMEVYRLMSHASPDPPLRPPKGSNNCFIAMFDFVNSTGFDFFIGACICLNVIVMSMWYYDQSDSYEFGLQVANWIFTGIFFIEMVLKLITLKSMYFASSWNVFDFIIVMGSLIDLGVFLANPNGESSLDLTILRVFRLLRMIRLINRAEGLKKLINMTILAASALINVGGLMLLLFVIYATMGMALFGDLQRREFINEHNNFENFGFAMFTLFRAVTGESWNGIMHDCMPQEVCDPIADKDTTCGSYLAVPYFVSFIFFGQFLMLNLFIAVLLDEFVGIGEKENEDAITNLRISDLSEYASLWAQYGEPRPWHAFLFDRVVGNDRNEFLEWSKFQRLMRDLHGGLRVYNDEDEHKKLLARQTSKGKNGRKKGLKRSDSSLKLKALQSTPDIPLKAMDVDGKRGLYVHYIDGLMALAHRAFKMNAKKAEGNMAGVNREMESFPDHIVRLRILQNRLNSRFTGATSSSLLTAEVPKEPNVISFAEVMAAQKIQAAFRGRKLRRQMAKEMETVEKERLEALKTARAERRSVSMKRRSMMGKSPLIEPKDRKMNSSSSQMDEPEALAEARAAAKRESVKIPTIERKQRNAPPQPKYVEDGGGDQPLNEADEEEETKDKENDNTELLRPEETPTADSAEEPAAEEPEE